MRVVGRTRERRIPPELDPTRGSTRQRPRTGDRGRSSRAAQEAALADLLDAHGDAVYRLARSVVRDSSLADDVVQETMVKAWRALPDFDGGEIPKAWLLKVARNTAISLLRTRRDDPTTPDDLVGVATTGAGTGQSATDKVAMEALWEAMADLDETSRSVVVMRELSGMTYEDIAEVLEIPLPTVKTRLFRARRVLQGAMEEWRR
ncbi:RNA polymerase sigma factor [Actinomarinicola tropica]|uniref:RNA polymerase sigma factor n=1 Tax=Actinomarinicola tropica TaxID=2789776 RepID=UPI00189BF0D1|nr:sigma-70 family RNA polymerase sigma factor [Actinomarinicola tropica]